MAKCKKSIDQIIECICDGSISSYAELEDALANTDFSVQQKSDILEQFFKFKLDNCEPTILEIESSTLQGCWQDASTGTKVSIEIVRNEDGSFKSYEIHTVAGIVSATTLAGYEPCSDPKIQPTQFPLCGGC